MAAFLILNLYTLPVINHGIGREDPAVRDYGADKLSRCHIKSRIVSLCLRRGSTLPSAHQNLVRIPFLYDDFSGCKSFRIRPVTKSKERNTEMMSAHCNAVFSGRIKNGSSTFVLRVMFVAPLPEYPA